MSISSLRVALVAGGGGLLAAWLAAAAMAPRADVPAPVAPPLVPPAARAEEPSLRAAADLATDLERLRQRLADAPGLRAGARNPFSLAPPPLPLRTAAPAPDPERVGRNVSSPPRAVGPALTLIGVASADTEDGGGRIGILTAPNGEVLLVGEGDRVPGGYLVDFVESASVTLVDGAGERHRLDLP